MLKFINFGNNASNLDGSRWDVSVCEKMWKSINAKRSAVTVLPSRLTNSFRKYEKKVVLTNILSCQKLLFFFTDTGGKKKWFPRPFVAVLNLLWSSLNLQKLQQKLSSGSSRPAVRWCYWKGMAAQFNPTVISTLPVLHAKGRRVTVLRCTAVYIGPTVAQLPPPLSSCLCVRQSQRVAVPHE